MLRVTVYREDQWYWYLSDGPASKSTSRNVLAYGRKAYNTESEAIGGAYEVVDRIKDGEIVYPGEGLELMLKQAELQHHREKMEYLEREIETLKRSNKALEAAAKRRLNKHSEVLA